MANEPKQRQLPPRARLNDLTPAQRQLAAGYRANAERDLAMAAEWFPLEEEAWQMLEASRKEPTKTLHNSHQKKK